jgi:hypothetical protein
MNPVVVAAIGVIVTIVTYNLASEIESRIPRALAQLGSVLIPVGLLGFLAGSPEAGMQAGQYYAGGIIAAYVLGKMFGGSKKST